jgi:hypothetical protein
LEEKEIYEAPEVVEKVWQIGPVGTPSPAIRYFDSDDSVLLGPAGVVCSG